MDAETFKLQALAERLATARRDLRRAEREGKISDALALQKYRESLERQLFELPSDERKLVMEHVKDKGGASG